MSRRRMLGGARNPYKAGDVINFDYTGDVQEITLYKGVYKLEAWGAQGIYSTASPTGSSNYWYGGYAAGTLILKKKTKLYIYVGGQPISPYLNGGWNGGGGKPTSNTRDNAPGPGATDFSLVGGECTLNASTYRYERDRSSYLGRILVAGGGGAGRSTHAYTNGGYVPSAMVTAPTAITTYRCGTLNAGGSCDSNVLAASDFGLGVSTTRASDDFACGGGGWYGGGCAGDSYGGAGSSWAWSDDATPTNSSYILSSYVPTDYAVSSDYKLTNTTFVSGGNRMPSSTDISATEVGHDGNGFARIQVIST